MAGSEAGWQTEQVLPAVAARPAECSNGTSHRHPMNSSAMALFPQPALLGNGYMRMGRKLRGQGWQIHRRDGGRTAGWSPGTEITDHPPLPEVAFNRCTTHTKGPGCLCLGHPSINSSHDLLAQRHRIGHVSASRCSRRIRKLVPFQTPFNGLSI